MEPRLEPIAAPRGPPIAKPMPPAAAVATPEAVPVTAFAFVEPSVDIPVVIPEVRAETPMPATAPFTEDEAPLFNPELRFACAP